MLRRTFLVCLLATTLLGVLSQDAASTTQLNETAEAALGTAARGPNCRTQPNGNPEAIKDVPQGCVARTFWENGCLRRSLKCNPATCGSNEESKCGGTCEPSCRVRRPRCSPNVQCIRSHCDCIQGFIRNELGLCVRQNQCHAQRECLTDIDCKDGWQCFSDRCRQRLKDPGACSRDSDCHRNQNCFRGRCRDVCFRNNDCGRNEICDRGRCRDRREDECRTNSDCDRRQVCARNRCMTDRFAPSTDEERCGNTTCLGNFVCMHEKCVEMHQDKMNAMMHDGACLIDDDCEMTEICKSSTSMCAHAEIATDTDKVTLGAQQDAFQLECRFDRDCRPGMRCFNDNCEDRFDGCDSRGCPMGHFCSRDRCIETRDDCRRDRDCRRGEFCFRGRCKRDECRSNQDCDQREDCNRGRCIDRRFSFRMHIMCIEDIDCDSDTTCVNGVCTVELSSEQRKLAETKPQSSVTCTQESDCTDGKSCVKGNCVASRLNQHCTANGDCLSNERCVNNRCNDAAFDRCDDRCSQNEMCFNGQCVGRRLLGSSSSNSASADKSPVSDQVADETALF